MEYAALLIAFVALVIIGRALHKRFGETPRRRHEAHRPDTSINPGEADTLRDANNPPPFS